MSAPINVADPGPAAALAEPDIKDYMRRASGVAGLLGPNGAAILAGIDTAERDAIAATVAAMGAKAATPRGQAATPRAQAATPRALDPAVDTAASRTTPATARLASVVTTAPPGITGPNPADALEGLAGAYMLTLSAPSMLAGLERGADGNHDAPPVTESRTTSRGETVRTTRLVTLIGSKLTFEIEMDISVGGPMPYTEHTTGKVTVDEHTTGKVTVDLCPDANGAVRWSCRSAPDRPCWAAGCSTGSP